MLQLLQLSLLLRLRASERALRAFCVQLLLRGMQLPSQQAAAVARLRRLLLVLRQCFVLWYQ
jgi:hypothetical protein